MIVSLKLSCCIHGDFVPLEINNSNLYELEEEQENIYLRISNESDLTLNITALILQADLSIVKFYPEGVSYEVVEPGQKIADEEEIIISLPENYQEGIDVIKVFATLDATNFQILELPTLDQSRKGFGDRQPTNALEELLVAVVDENSPQRNMRIKTSASKKWTTEKVEVLVRK
ncbi:MAG: hypothetical protein F6K24_13595 [Okeania sp. SIO2D1]|nr:hypothetical protein [Okeania sp. SIO2D1]